MSTARTFRTLAMAGVVAAGGCADQPVSPPGASAASPPVMSLTPTAAAGRAAFAAACASCHTSRDGFDLAFFGFTDTTIVRRAVHHVDTATALTIVEHVRSLDVAPVGRDHRPFQVPRVSSDVAFALRLFGRDAWPTFLDEKALLAVDPTRVSAAVAFPLWSDESSKLDWMPDTPLPPSVAGAPEGPVRRALGVYAARASDQALVRAVQLLRSSARDPESGPCFQTEDGALRDPGVCFEATRWIASLGAQHVLRTGADLGNGVGGSTAVSDAFWDVGQAARRSLLKNQDPVDHAEENWVSWMYMGWIMAPGNHASTYTSGGLARVGLPRHASFVAVRSMASRAQASAQAFADLNTVARHAPPHWLAGAYATGLAVLEARVARGWKPTDEAALTEAAASLERAARLVRVRLGGGPSADLVARTQALVAALGA